MITHLTICWEPAPRCHKKCRELILSVLSARTRLWEGEVLDTATSRLRNEVKRHLPDWPVHQRTELSKEDRRAHDEVHQATADCLEAIFRSQQDEMTTPDTDDASADAPRT